ncbi:hypothetical protein chiPu_0030763, partial [Chiloscyllium punctatum]|nr:hypothetical protein [Chiloscyllium punctatum]
MLPCPSGAALGEQSHRGGSKWSVEQDSEPHSTGPSPQSTRGDAHPPSRLDPPA